MWCSQCQSDVATEISADGARLLCTICGEEVRKVFAPSQHPETQSARELLERWSKSELLSSFDSAEPEVESAAASPVHLPETTPEPQYKRPQFLAARSTAEPADEVGQHGADLLPSPHPRAAAASEPVEEAVERPVRKIHRAPQPLPPPEPPRRPEPRHTPPRQIRIDDAHEEHSPEHVETRPDHSTLERAVERTEHAAAWTRRDQRDDRAHATLSAPHFDMEVFMQNSGRKPGRQESIFGQILAYLGVGLLTVGTALVVWGYFGGPAVQRYQSTGWLISTAGQMLLFLGVVTLVSGGMQQTSHEVSQRVEYLGGRMHRIEQSTQELLKGPYFAKERSGKKVGTGDEDAQRA